ncbi:MAG: hypothetical protein O7C60_07420, partial [Rickettsia endosymbiont of Ixodes persulcatus]|nr:hypothetical protein [Rickettsia endosymbiont of Ixodes persulcatus]
MLEEITSIQELDDLISEKSAVNENLINQLKELASSLQKKKNSNKTDNLHSTELKTKNEAPQESLS